MAPPLTLVGQKGKIKGTELHCVSLANLYICYKNH